MRRSLATTIRSSVKDMEWLEPSDQGVVALALAYAESIDTALKSGDDGLAAKALYLGPHLLNTLKALGGAPAERKALGMEEAVSGKLAQLRSASSHAA